MKVTEFDYDLPEELIAQKPLPDRDQSRLLKLNRENGSLEQGYFKDIVNYLQPGDLVVLNNSRVISARLFGQKASSGIEIEILLLKQISEQRWEVLVKPGRRVKKDTKIIFGEGILEAHVIDYTDFGGRIIEFHSGKKLDKVMEELGEMPLPPYIKEKLDNPERYQTVYASKKGSAAAPTAGLHFTPELLDKIKEKGVNIKEITLHVGIDTFRPVRVEKVEEHKMHSEYYEISKETAQMIKKTYQNGKKVVAVGTTVTRTLEGAALQKGIVEPGQGWTDIFIYPGYQFKIINGLITNFHLPKSTLLMLVSAFADREKIFQAYQKAIEEEFRFFSFGDAMFIY